MSRGIRHIESESSTVKATLEVHYSNTLSCSCHRQAMKALTWQRKHLNEIVHIFHSSVLEVVPLQGKFTAPQTPQTCACSRWSISHWLLSPWPSFAWTTCTSGPSWPEDVSLSLSVVHFSQVSCSTGPRCQSDPDAHYSKNTPQMTWSFIALSCSGKYILKIPSLYQVKHWNPNLSTGFSRPTTPLFRLTKLQRTKHICLLCNNHKWIIGAHMIQLPTQSSFWPVGLSTLQFSQPDGFILTLTGSQQRHFQYGLAHSCLLRNESLPVSLCVPAAVTFDLTRCKTSWTADSNRATSLISGPQGSW